MNQQLPTIRIGNRRYNLNQIQYIEAYRDRCILVYNGTEFTIYKDDNCDAYYKLYNYWNCGSQINCNSNTS